MAYLLYSYQLKMEVPLLDEDEWHQVFESGSYEYKDISKYAKAISYHFENKNNYQSAVHAAHDNYKKITHVELDALQLLHVRLSTYGSPCPVCNKPFRTPKARFCMECGHELEEGQIAGSALAEDLQKYKISGPV